MFLVGQGCSQLLLSSHGPTLELCAHGWRVRSEHTVSNSYIAIMQINSNLLKNLKSFCGKRDAFDCVEIRARALRLLVESFDVGSGKNFELNKKV